MRFMTKTLELDQIKEIILKYMKSDSAKNKLNQLEPFTDLDIINQKLDEVLEMLELIAKLEKIFDSRFTLYTLIFSYGKRYTSLFKTKTSN